MDTYKRFCLRTLNQVVGAIGFEPI